MGRTRKRELSPDSASKSTVTSDIASNKRPKRGKKGESSNNVHKASSSGASATVSSDVSGTGDGLSNKHQAHNEKEDSSNTVHEASSSEMLPSSEDLSKDYKCSICLDTNNLEEMKQLKCAHTFHKMCIDAWLDIGTSCPICRDEIPSPLGRFNSSSDQDMTLEEVLSRIQEVMFRRSQSLIPATAEQPQPRVLQRLEVIPATGQPRRDNERIQELMQRRPGLRRVAMATQQLQVVRQEFHSHIQELRRRLDIYHQNSRLLDGTSS